MPQEWIDIKNPFDEDVPGGNVEVYHTGRPATTNHLKKNLVGYFIESVMIVPIIRNDKTIAMLELIHDCEDKTFSQQDLKLAQKFAIRLEPLLPI